MIICIDTEFTDLIGIVVDIKLISAGFVAGNGREFYFELTDNFETGECSSFVVEAVLPHLNHPIHGMTKGEAAARLKVWIESFDEPVELATDAPGYDWALLAELLRDHGCWPENLASNPLNVNVGNVQQGIETYFEYQPMGLRHHALWDARALAAAIKGNA